MEALQFAGEFGQTLGLHAQAGYVVIVRAIADVLSLTFSRLATQDRSTAITRLPFRKLAPSPPSPRSPPPPPRSVLAPPLTSVLPRFRARTVLDEGSRFRRGSPTQPCSARSSLDRA